MKLYLATTSKFKSELLNQACIKHELIGTDVDEVSDSDNVYDYVMDLSYLKASSVDVKGIVVGLDTVVMCNDKIMEKPKDIDEVRSNLKELSNNVNHVITGICIIDTINNKVLKTYDETKVFIRELTDRDIDFYLENEKYAMSSSGYVIENVMSSFVSKIEGTYTNILGLPTNKIVESLKTLGITIQELE